MMPPDFIGALMDIVALSLAVTAAATLFAVLLAMPLGAILALFRFPGRDALIIAANAMIALPPVVVGLAVYMLLSRAGPLGMLELLYTPQAMMIAQTIIITPIIIALTRQVIADLWRDMREQLHSLGAGRWRAIPILLHDARASLTTAVMTGFGRGLGEVGAVAIVGGNIEHATRVMTTAIALETSKGNLRFALALGGVLLLLSLLVNGAAWLLASRGRTT